MRGVQSRRVREEQAQLFCTRAHWVMQRFCTILPVYLAHFSRSHDRITRPCNLCALIQQALISPKAEAHEMQLLTGVDPSTFIETTVINDFVAPTPETFSNTNSLNLCNSIPG